MSGKKGGSKEGGRNVRREERDESTLEESEAEGENDRPCRGFQRRDPAEEEDARRQRERCEEVEHAESIGESLSNR